MTVDFALLSLAEANQSLNLFLAQPDLTSKFQLATAYLSMALSKKITVLSCGNGGSSCDAMHFAEELTGRYRKNRPALPALALTDPSYLTCVANDFGYEAVFSRGVEAFGQKGGVLLAISTSGNSPNILKAIEMARSREMKIIGLSGHQGGKMAALCDVLFLAPGSTTDRIQEIHIKIIHILIEGIERNLFPENY